MNTCFKRTVVMSGYGGERPVFTAERTDRWRYVLRFFASFDGVYVYDGKNVQYLTEKEGVLTVNPENGLAVALTHGGVIASFGTNGQDISQSDFEKSFLISYDDEAIAEENYYGADYEQRNENVGVKADDSGCQAGAENEGGAPYDDAGGGAYKEQRATAGDPDAVQRAESARTPVRRYYDQVGCRIEHLFRTGKPFSPLKSVIPNSRWVETSDGKKSYYLGRQGKPDYICYAVKGKRGDSPFDGAFFVPDSFFSPSGEGFFVTFQSAETGERIIPTQKVK